MQNKNLSLINIFSTMNEKEQNLNRAIAQIALLKGINTTERYSVAKKYANQMAIK